MQQFLSAMQFSISVQQFYDFFQQLCNQIPLNIATKKHVSGSNMWLYTQGLHTALLSGGTKKMRDESECTIGLPWGSCTLTQKGVSHFEKQTGNHLVL